MTPEMMQTFQAFWPIGLMVLIFYFLLYRPQKKEQNRRKEMLDNLKKGDKIITAGGIYGTITALNEKAVTLRIAEKVEIDLARTSIGTKQGE
jgi:preprotein translocase subunit YajC